jgi:hypothetical protein
VTFVRYSFPAMQGLPGCLPWGMLLVFFNDFLAQQKGFSVPAATLVRCAFLYHSCTFSCCLHLRTRAYCIRTASVHDGWSVHKGHWETLKP